MATTGGGVGGSADRAAAVTSQTTPVSYLGGASVDAYCYFGLTNAYYISKKKTQEAFMSNPTPNCPKCACTDQRLYLRIPEFTTQQMGVYGICDTHKFYWFLGTSFVEHATSDGKTFEEIRREGYGEVAGAISPGEPIVWVRHKWSDRIADLNE